LRPCGPVHVLDLFPPDREALLALLAELDDEAWARPTVCEGWTAKDVALHLLGDDIGLLSRRRDAFQDMSLARGAGDLSVWENLVAYLNRWNEAWVGAARRISPPLLIDLLRFAGEQTQRYFESLDLEETGPPVSWAGPQPAPVWLDVAREYTERWLHQQQIRDAVERPGQTEPRFLSPVLDTFVRALPHTFHDVLAPEDTHVRLTVSGEAGGVWSLVRHEAHWALYHDVEMEPVASVNLDQDVAWRLFTRGLTREEALATAVLDGDRSLGLRVLSTVSIIA
jgi:uncharacterized protein (TIGR03083 family)